MRYVLHGINPVPWKSPDVAIINVKGRKIPRVYKNPEVKVYQDAIKEAFTQMGEVVMLDPDERIELRFHFWRKAGTRHDHISDVTNCQKALEDALQGVLYPNDRMVVHADAWMVEQGPDVEPRIVIELNPAPPPPAFIVEPSDRFGPEISEPDSDPTFSAEDYF